MEPKKLAKVAYMVQIQFFVNKKYNFCDFVVIDVMNWKFLSIT